MTRIADNAIAYSQILSWMVCKNTIKPGCKLARVDKFSEGDFPGQGQKSKVRCWKLEIGSLKSEFRSQNSGVRINYDTLIQLSFWILYDNKLK